MKAEIVAIGTELLLGQIIDTNSAHMGQQLQTIGADLYYTTCVGDNIERIKEVLAQALERSDVIITTGGIGPTEDDLTRQAAAEVMNTELEFRQDLMDHIEAIFKRANYTMSPSNRRQAYIPKGSTPIDNPRGTAPGFIVSDERGTIISVPGVPHEMRFLMETAVIPYMKEKFGISSILKYRTLKTAGMGESTVNEVIKDLMDNPNPTVGLLAGLGEIRIRIAAKGADEGEADALIGEMEQEITARLGEHIFGYDDETLEEVVGRLLTEREKSLALAETLTGGALCQRLSVLPGNGLYFKEGLIGSNRLVAEKLVEGVPSADREVDISLAEDMAKGIREAAGVDIGLAIIGMLRPEDGDDIVTRLPAYAAVAAEGKVMSREHSIGGGIKIVQTRVSNLALDMVRRYLLDLELPG